MGEAGSRDPLDVRQGRVTLADSPLLEPRVGGVRRGFAKHDRLGHRHLPSVVLDHGGHSGVPSDGRSSPLIRGEIVKSVEVHHLLAGPPGPTPPTEQVKPVLRVERQHVTRVRLNEAIHDAYRSDRKTCFYHYGQFTPHSRPHRGTWRLRPWTCCPRAVPSGPSGDHEL